MGQKPRGSLAGIHPGRHRLGLFCVPALGINGIMEWDVWDSAMGDLGWNWEGILVWQRVCVGSQVGPVGSWCWEGAPAPAGTVWGGSGAAWDPPGWLHRGVSWTGVPSFLNMPSFCTGLFPAFLGGTPGFAGTLAGARLWRRIPGSSSAAQPGHDSDTRGFVFCVCYTCMALGRAEPWREAHRNLYHGSKECPALGSPSSVWELLWWLWAGHLCPSKSPVCPNNPCLLCSGEEGKPLTPVLNSEGFSACKLTRITRETHLSNKKKKSTKVI